MMADGPETHPHRFLIRYQGVAHGNLIPGRLYRLHHCMKGGGFVVYVDQPGDGYAPIYAGEGTVEEAPADLARLLDQPDDYP